MATNFFNRLSTCSYGEDEDEEERALNELISAAQDGDLDRVKELCSPGGAAVISAGSKQPTAAGKNKPANPIDINGMTMRFSMTPLQAAVKNGHVTIVRHLLIQDKIDVNVKDSGGYTPLLLAAQGGNASVLEAIFDATNVDPPVDRNAQNNYGEDALMCAAEAGHLELVKFLVDKVVDVNRTNKLDYTAFSLAVKEGHLDIVKLLSTPTRIGKININAKSADKKKTVLMLGTIIGDVKLVEYILTAKWREELDLEATDSKGSTALMSAAAAGYSKIVEFLCRHGADVNKANYGTGFNALILACKYGHSETVEILLDERSIDIKAGDNKGRNALFIASKYNKLDCVKAILKEPEDLSEVVNAVTNDRQSTPLTAAWNPEIMLELIKANGCDVRNLPCKQTALRKEIRRSILESGEKTSEVWQSILDKEADFVLPIIALIAEDFTEEDLKKDAGKFFNEDPRCQEYRLGVKKDSEDNTIYHYIAKSPFASKCKVALKALIPKENLERVLGLKNKQGNTLLHTAAHYGNLNAVFEVVKKIMKGAATEEVKAAFKLENVDKQTFIAASVKSTSEDCTENLQNIMQTLTSLKPEGYDMNFIYKSCDSGGNTLLHLAARRDKFDMISYLADKPIEERALNEAGFNPLHIAVLDNNNELFEHIYATFQHRFHINERTGENETVLHIAAKQGNVELLKRIVELGGDLSSQDNDGHTPLHDCLQQVHLEGGSTIRERCEKFSTVWNQIVDVAVTWWCGPSFLNVPMPDQDSQFYKDFQRDAVYYLRSCIRNKKEMSVLQYGAYLGVTACIETILTQQNVFIKKYSTDKGKVCPYEIEITNLMPEYAADILYHYEGYGCLNEKIEEKHNYKGTKTTLIETLAKVKPPLKSTEMLRCVPMARLTKWQWNIYQLFSIIWLVIHCTVMGVCTRAAQTEIRNFPVTTNSPQIINGSFTNNESVVNPIPIMYGKEDLTSDTLILLYALTIFTLMTILPIWRFIKYVKKKFAARKISQEDQPKYKIYNEYVTDKGAILSCLTYLLAFTVEQMSSILPICFAIFACLLFHQVESGDVVTISSYAFVKGNFLLFGWLLVLVPARTYSPIYNFLSTLKFIVIKDMLPFVLFYIIITIAFSCAMQLQFQLLTPGTIDNAEDASGFQNFLTKMPTVLYELIIMTTGMDTDLKHIQHVADMFHEDDRNSMFIELLLIVYAIISVIILLNMLIAMMGTTMSRVFERHGTGWRQYQVIQALRIRRFFLNFKMFLNYCCRKPNSKGKYQPAPQNQTHQHHHHETTVMLDKLMQMPGKTRRDERTNRWYLELTRFELKEIRAKYWKIPEVKLQKDEAVFQEYEEAKELNEDEILMLGENVEETEKESPLKNFEARMTQMEENFKLMENTLVSKLESIESVLSELKKKV